MSRPGISRPRALCIVVLLSVPFTGAAAIAAAGQPAAPPGAQAGPPPAPDTAIPPPVPAAIRPETVNKAGKALHDVIRINQSYGAKLAAAKSDARKRALVAEAKDKAMGAITAQGLSVEKYSEVLVAAERDPAIRAQLLEAAGIPAKK